MTGKTATPKSADRESFAPVSHYREFVTWYGPFAPYVGMRLCITEPGIDPGIKQVITRNFIARAAVALRGVLALWEARDYQDCWVIYRTILDRLFHLHHLIRTESWQLFDDWCFWQQYNARNAIRSSADFKEKIDPAFFRDAPDDKARMESLKTNPPKWERPFAEVEARDMGLLFLYRQGYDFASTLVHPMANDGQQDYTTVTGFGGPWPDQVAAVNNACLAALLLLQEAMKTDPGRRWHPLVLRCMEQARESLRSGARDYLVTFFLLGKASPEGRWCDRAGG